jgi:CO/xanthine dehydrogenase FAD-binding subunit
MSPDLTYARPRTLDEALAALAAGPSRILAGGTDFYPGLGDRPATGAVIDISAIAGLDLITAGPTQVRFGARTSWSRIAEAELPRAFDALKAAAREVGSIQIQNAGTIAGNICNASPAADGIPPLLALDAEVEIASLAGGVKKMPLAAFLTGYRKTALRPGELVTAIAVPRTIEGASTFLKLGARRHLVISIAMVAAIVEIMPGGRIGKARIAVGACSAVAQRLFEAEAALAGLPARSGASRAIAQTHLAGLAPIDDVRATSGYRRDAALTLVRRAVESCIAESRK